MQSSWDKVFHPEPADQSDAPLLSLLLTMLCFLTGPSTLADATLADATLSSSKLSYDSDSQERRKVGRR